MRFRLHLLFGIFIILAALVAGFVPQTVKAPPPVSPAGLTGEITPRPISWATATSGICLIRVTDGEYTATATGFVIRTGEILSSRVNLCPYASHGLFLIWPNSFTNPDTHNNFDSSAVIATATFPGCDHPVPLEVDGFSETSNVVRYRFDTKWVAAPVVTVNLLQTLEVGRSYQARGYESICYGIPVHSKTKDSPRLETGSVTKLDEIVGNIGEETGVIYDHIVMVGFSPGTPVFNGSGEVVGLFKPEGGMGSLGEGVRTIKPVSRSFEAKSAD